MESEKQNELLIWDNQFQKVSNKNAKLIRAKNKKENQKNS
jgi:hypothetical protein